MPGPRHGGRQQFGPLGVGAARSLALRHDRGGNVMSDVFQRQIRFRGMAPSYAFVSKSETNGVIERLFRTLKGRVVHGRLFQTIDEVRDAVRTFVTRCNAEWLIEKNSHRSPDAMHAAWNEQSFRRAARDELSSRDPGAVRADMLTRLVNRWPQSRIDELMPWHWAPTKTS
jgi:putative transposase